MGLMLQGQVSDTQTGAFVIAHRIRQTEPLELAGMLDHYKAPGPLLRTPGRRTPCLGCPTTAVALEALR